MHLVSSFPISYNVRVTTRRTMSEANGEDLVLDDWAKSKTKAILESMIIKGEIPEEDWPPESRPLLL
jgi:hypothetical protein